MRHTGLVNRIQRVESRRRHVDVTQFAHQLAEAEGCSVMELIAEAERIAAACHRQEITSTDGMVRYLAQEQGISVAELMEEMARYREGTR